MTTSPPASGAPPARTARRSPVWTLALTGVGIFMVILDALVVVTALPLIRSDVGGDVSSLQWILSAYLLAFGAGIITAASLGDRFGRRRLFVIGLVLFAVASAGCAVAPTIGWLILARTIQGVGAAIVTPLSLSLLIAAFPPERRGSVLGLWGAIGGVAVAAGPLVGGGITQALSWHWIFWINVPIGLVAAVLTYRLMDESRGAAEPLDVPGAVLVTAASVGLLWGLARGNEAGWTSLEILVSLSAGFLLLIAFVLWERRATHPMVPPGLFRNRSFAAANLVGFLALGSLLAAAFYMSQYLQVVLGYGPFDAGLRFLPWTATPLLVAPIAGRLADRIGPRPLVVIGLLLQATGLGLIRMIASPTASFEMLALPLVIGGVGISLVLPSAPVAAFAAAGRANLGKASGVFNSLQRFGGAFVLALATAAFTSSGQLFPAAQFMDGFRAALGVSVGLSVLGAVVGLAIAKPAAQVGVPVEAVTPAPAGI